MIASVSTTPDRQNGIINTATVYFLVIYSEQFRIKVYIQETYKDTNYSRMLFQSAADGCRIAEGSVAVVFFKAVIEPMLKLANFKIAKCPFKANFTYLIPNLTISDTFLPPAPFGMKFKINFEMFGKVKEFKEMINFYNWTIYGKYKKKVFGASASWTKIK